MAHLSCKRLVLAACPRVAPREGRILSYHGVGTRQWGVYDITPAGFQRQLHLALELGYRFVPQRRSPPAAVAQESRSTTD